MPEHLRALIVILVVAAIFFALVRRPACSIAGDENFTRRRNLWLSLTVVAFLAGNFWTYTLFAIPLMIHANRKEINLPALYFFILFVIPTAYIKIPGMGLINFLFDFSHARIIALFILLPAFIALIRRSETLSFGRTATDKILAAYLLLTALLYLREPTLTNTFRQVFYLFIDIFLPYFVISRSLKNLQDFREAALSLVLAIMVLAPLAILESYKHWLLYSSLTDVLGLEGMMKYLGRDGMLRALVTAGQPIALGYLMVVGMGLYLFLQQSIKQKTFRVFGMLLLVAGLIAPLSRGPWLGAVLLIIIFIASGRYALRRLIGLALGAVLIISLVTVIPGGEKAINLMPFIGSTEKENVDYREKLIANSMIVIQRNPWFGSVNYLATPEMESMRQGQGIIDIVNTYVWLALEKGFIGLGLFVGFFSLTTVSIFRAARSIQNKDSEERLLGRVLLATLLSILAIIFSVSSITVIPIVYWSVASLGVAYVQMVRRNIE